MASKYAHRKGYTLEKKVAEDVDGKTNKRGPDVRSDKFLLECKVRDSKGEKSISIKKEWLIEVIEQAEKEGLVGGLAFRFAGDKHYWVIFPSSILERIQ